MRRSRIPAAAASGSFIAGVGALLVLPTLIVIPMSFSAADILIFPPIGFSFRWYENFFSDPQWRAAAVNSVTIALGTTCLATVLGVLAALGLARIPLRYRGGLTLFFLAPAVVPTIVTAIATYQAFARMGLSGTIGGVILGHTILALPFVVLYVSAVLQRVDWRLVHAARSLGATPARALFLVTIPAIMPGIVAGAVFAFVTSFDEVVVALFLCGTRAVTLPVEMWNGIRFEINPTVAAASVILLLISSSVLVLVSLLRKGRA